jgi:hypothetical protein
MIGRGLRRARSATSVGASDRRALQDIARSYNVSHPTIMRLFPNPFEQSAAA